MAQIKRNLDEEKFKLELEKDMINDVNVDEFILLKFAPEP